MYLASSTDFMGGGGGEIITNLAEERGPGIEIIGCTL